jgi:hypothetical protein
MTVLVFVLVLVAAPGVRLAAIVTQVITDRTTRCAAQSCADSRTGGAAEAVANHGPACGAEATANGSFRAVAFVRADGTTGRTANAGTYRSAGAATELAANHIAQRATQSTTHCGRAIIGGHGALGHEQSQNQCG